MKYINLILAILFVSNNTFAKPKDTFYRKTPLFIPVIEEDLKLGDAVIIEDNRSIDYVDNKLYKTRHSIIHITNSAGLDENNKIVVHYSSEGEIIKIKARSISPTGVITEIKSSNIKEMKDYKVGGNLKVFAIEGAEVGGQIEYYYQTSSPMYDTGREYFSNDHKTLKGVLLIRYTSGLNVASKSFNTYVEAKHKENEDKYFFKNILPISDELYSTPESNSVYVEYKIKGGMYVKVAYDDYQGVFKDKVKLFYEFSQDEFDLAKTVLKSFNYESDDYEDVLRELNIFLKKKYRYDSNSSNKSIKSIVENGVGTSEGLTKFYCLIIKTLLPVKYNVLLTANKNETWVDTTYCSRYSLDESLLYFPEYESYIFPASSYTHYNLIPSWLIGNKALIIKPNTSYVNFMEIPSYSSELNSSALEIDVDLDLNNGVSNFNLVGYGTGNVAASYNYSIYYSETDEEKKQELNDLITWRYPDCELVSAAMLDPERWGNIEHCEDYECIRGYEAKIKSSTFYEKTGDKILLKIGTLIGPQDEMYTEKQRTQPITKDYNKCYKFEITIPIPEGYAYGGENNAIIDNVFKNKKGVIVAGFKSEIVVKDNVIVINIYEHYEKVNIAKSYYEEYRKIVNSAADFNKSIILLIKK